MRPFMKSMNFTTRGQSIPVDHTTLPCLASYIYIGTYLVEETGNDRWQTSKIKTTVHNTFFFTCSQIVKE